jgi:FlaA1/EpsC-like NDP-sugar epimerase
MFDRSQILLELLSNKALGIFRKHYVPKWMVFLFDNLAVYITFLVAYLLRYNFISADFSFAAALQQGMFAVGVYAVFSLCFRSYTGLIRHTTVIDIFYVLLATSFAVAVLLITSLLGRMMDSLPNIFDIPLSIIIIHFIFVTLFLCCVRIVVKIFYQIITSSSIDKKKVLIYGAGAMGVIAKRVIQSDIRSDYHISGFLDNNKTLQGTKLNGIPVYNPLNVLNPEFLRKRNIKAMIFAIRDISPVEKSEIFRSALNVGLEVFEIPAVETWFNGQFHASQIRKVKLEDLLGRDPIQLNMKKIGIGLRGKTILVTGAAGSIGSEIVRQLTRFNVGRLILVDQAETPMFNLENELKTSYSDSDVQIILADITQPDKMEYLFRQLKPEIIFHAAAYKHVPLMEENPHEAIRVNVGGTKILTSLAVKYGIKKFVMISTDKAVNPTNVMGASKRLCEMVVQLKAQKQGNKTQFIITRFGNVLGSNGSVIPIFTKQIEDGGPVTVTDPQITRYFMTIPEACQLVLEAGFMGKGGEIFVFDMGNPVKIVDLARQMIRMSGHIPEEDIKIEFTGLRPGEKLFEELLSDAETTKPTHHQKIKIALVDKVKNKDLLAFLDNLLANLYSYSKQDIVDYCTHLVPEYNCINSKYLRPVEKGLNDQDKADADEFFNHTFKVSKMFFKST